MDDVKPQREYHSTRREQQAQATRAAIVAAARTLFVRDGYAATSVRAIAAEAGVSDQTIYAAFGSKRALLTALWNALDVNAGVMELRDRLQAAHGDPGRQLDPVHRRRSEGHGRSAPDGGQAGPHSPFRHRIRHPRAH